jgi:glycogen operon protein
VADNGRTYMAGDTFDVHHRSLVVLREHHEPEAEPDHSVAASVAARAEPGNQGTTRARRHG